MGSLFLRRVARSSFTGLVLVAVLVTTFLPVWTTRAGAESVDETVPQGVTPNQVPIEPVGTRAPTNAVTHVPEAPVPLNRLVIAEAGREDVLARTITGQGGTIYVRQGQAFFAGIDTLRDSDLMAAGARFVFQETVPPGTLEALPPEAQAAARVWNEMAGADSASSLVAPFDGSAPTRAVINPAPVTQGAQGLYAPTAEQTSVFMAGDVAVKVLFIESAVATEDWTTTEVDQVKTEITQALEWWSTVATVPATPDGPTRPSAHLTWNVSYVSPFDGPVDDRAKIVIADEPILGNLSDATAIDGGDPANSGWVHQVASAFTGLPADGTSARQLADDARTSGGADWGFTLYVVDSSNDADGLFGDGLAGSAALNGPWAVVSYDGGDLGADRLEVLIAKMVGHIFGAGDESDNPATGSCRQESYYGYLRIAHSNCEYNNPGAVDSLMRDGDVMVQAYNTHALSESARQQVGWRDSDNNGIYDIFETLEDGFAGFFTDPVCPAIHFSEIPIINDPARPNELGPGDTEEQWTAYIWDGAGFSTDLVFTPVTINIPSYVWGRLVDGEWIEASPTDGAWDEIEETYNLVLTGESGVVNEVEVAIFDRWEQQVYYPDAPQPVAVNPALERTGDPALDRYESDDPIAVSLFDAIGNPGGWSASVADDGYSPGGPGSVTMIADGVGSEACFAFNGTEVTLIYSKESVGAANVYVDGELHSIITFADEAQKQAQHVIANLAPGDHMVQIVSSHRRRSRWRPRSGQRRLLGEYAGQDQLRGRLGAGNRRVDRPRRNAGRTGPPHHPRLRSHLRHLRQRGHGRHLSRRGAGRRFRRCVHRR